MSRQVSVEDAYREACQALGEATVMQRLQAQHIARVEAERDELLHPADKAPDSP